MIGFVIVSHSATLAEGVCELARQVARENVRLAPAGGTNDPEHPIGTDAFKVLEAIESVYSDDGVLVLMDLGSAVLSAETAVELLDERKRSGVRLCAAPLVEGTVAAVSQAAAGASLSEIIAVARNSLTAKTAQLAGEAAAFQAAAVEEAGPSEEVVVTVANRLGLHARPSAELIRRARRYAARITLENVSRAACPVSADSINGILALGARQGHRLRLCARGADARQALAEIAAFINGGCGEAEQTIAAAPGQAPAEQVAPHPGRLAGIPASAGIAVGPLVKLRSRTVDAGSRVAADPVAERRRLMAALAAAQEETRALYEWSKIHTGANAAGIFDAQLLFLEDPALIAEVCRRIAEDGSTAELAWNLETEKLAGRLGELEDEYLRARGADVTDAAVRVLRRLTGAASVLPMLREPSIVAAHDLTPSDVSSFDRTNCLGLCLEMGSPSAHSVILARAMSIPVVVGVGPGITTVAEGTMVAIDGQRGLVWISPGADEVAALTARREQWLADRRLAEIRMREPAATRDGRRIRVLANISGVAEAAEALNHGAEGVGVLRTEFLFLGRAEPPGEEEQLAAYRAIAESLGDRPLIIRTLDIGGDKQLPYIEIGEEANPFLGWRGIRVTLGMRDLFRTQLRAILRAGANREIRLLLPMITSTAELRETKAVLFAIEAALEREGVPYVKNMKVGVMIEAPAAVAIAGQLAREAGFFSIGTNDLVQYVMAADRTNSRVSRIADAFQPAVLQMIRQAVDAARGSSIEVTVCGELAADPLATPLLIGLGLEELSVSAPLVPELKRSISHWSVAEAESIAREALAMDSSASVRQVLGRAVELKMSQSG